VDLPRSFTIRESSHRIHNAFTSGKLATLGQALSLPPGTRMLDLACGSGEPRNSPPRPPAGQTRIRGQQEG
jgi:hypothetical protein